MLRVVEVAGLTHQPSWHHYRVIHSIYPPRNLFDEGQSLEDLALLSELEGETSDRLMRWRESVALQDARFGDGWGPVMASFCYINPGRFNSSQFGCYYGANSIEAAITEWSFHAAKVWLEFGYNAIANATVRSYFGVIEHPLRDVTSEPSMHDPNSYSLSQQFGQRLKDCDSFGVLFRSVRHPDAYCIGLLRPPATSPVKQGAHYSINWNGDHFDGYQKLGQFQPIPRVEAV